MTFEGKENLAFRRVNADGSGEGFGRILSEAMKASPLLAAVGFHVAMRELQSEFRANRFGMLWLFLTPMIYVVAFVAVRNGLESRGLQIGGGHVPGAVFALSGLLVYQAWFDSAMGQLSAFTRNKSLIKNIGIEPETFFYAGLVKTAILTAPKLLLLTGAICFLGADLSSFSSLPAYTAVLAAACVSGGVSGYLLAPLGAVVNDIKVALQSASLALLLGSAVFFNPASFGQTGLVIFGFNPIACLVDAGRYLLFGGEFPLFWFALSWAAISAVLLPFSLVFARVTRRIVAERL